MVQGRIRIKSDRKEECLTKGFRQYLKTTENSARIPFVAEFLFLMISIPIKLRSMYRNQGIITLSRLSINP
jgi:uncharacterized protein (DUF2164 family)